MANFSVYRDGASPALRRACQETGIEPRDDDEWEQLFNLDEWMTRIIRDRIWGNSVLHDGRMSDRQWLGLNRRLVIALGAAVATSTWTQVRSEFDSDATDLVVMVGRLMESWHEFSERLSRPEQELGGSIRAVSGTETTIRMVGSSAAELGARKHAVMVVPTAAHRDEANPMTVGRGTQVIEVELGWDTAIFGANSDDCLPPVSVAAAHDTPGDYVAPYACGIAEYRSYAHLFDAVREAREILQICETMQLPPHTYRLEDITLEVLLARSPDVAALLAERVRPLVTHGQQLVETLREFLDSRDDKKRIARSLNIHQNTLAYRLRRIEDLTGLRPSRHRDAYVLRAGCLSENLLSRTDRRSAR